MNRKEFITLATIGSASITIGACFGACKNKDTGNSPAATPAPIVLPNDGVLTIDLNDVASAALKNAGSYIYKNGLIIAKTNAGNYLAVAQACPHQGTSVQYIGAEQSFYCPNHGAKFNENGGLTQGPATVGLTKYKTSVNGTILWVQLS